MLQNWWLIDDDTLGKVREYLRGKDDDLLHLVNTGMHKTSFSPSDYAFGSPIDTTGALELIAGERKRQLAKWGEQHHHPGKWMLILQEELGEASQDFLQDNGDPLAELVQAAAVIVAWIEDLSIPAD